MSEIKDSEIHKPVPQSPLTRHTRVVEQLGRDYGPSTGASEREAPPTRSTWTLFEEPYWLDCVAPGAWEAVEIASNGRVAARLPYFIKRKYHMTALTLPPLTPWLGPWIAPIQCKTVRQLGEQHQLLRELVRQLPKAARVQIACAPEYTNLHALASEGWALNVSYTYRLEHAPNLDLIWEGLMKSTRNRIRHARQKLEVVTQLHQPQTLIDLLVKSFKVSAPSRTIPSVGSLVERIDGALGSREQRIFFTAVDSRNRPHASTMLVFDDRHVFMLLRASDDSLRKSGADSLIVWEAIKFASTRSIPLDFAGSMIPSIERFNRGFGPRQIPYYHATKQSRLSEFAQLLR